jgi:hypothetical protein
MFHHDTTGGQERLDTLGDSVSDGVEHCIVYGVAGGLIRRRLRHDAMNVRAGAIAEDQFLFFRDGREDRA